MKKLISYIRITLASSILVLGVAAALPADASGTWMGGCTWCKPQPVCPWQWNQPTWNQPTWGGNMNMGMSWSQPTWNNWNW